MQRDDVSLIIDVVRTHSPFGKKGPNEMETLAIATYDPGTKFKHVVVNLRGMNANTFVIVGNVKQALKKAGANPMELFLFVGNALSNNYEHALATVLKWVTITDEPQAPIRDAWTAMLEIMEQYLTEPSDDPEEEQTGGAA